MYQHGISYIFTVAAQILYNNSVQHSAAFSTATIFIIADFMSARYSVTNVYCSLISYLIPNCHFIISTQGNVAIAARFQRSDIKQRNVIAFQYDLIGSQLAQIDDVAPYFFGRLRTQGAESTTVKNCSVLYRPG